MAKFYVGQRVRVVRAKSLRETIGKEGTVARIEGIQIFVALDGMRSDADDGLYKGRSHNLEPLTDPGREVVSWDECAWKPEHLRDHAAA